MPKPESLRGKKIALFGLSANPPTGYQDQNIFSEIWILPVYQHMFIAKKGLLAFEHRMAMCKLCMETSAPANMTTVRVLPLEKIVLEYFASKKSDVTRTGTIDVSGSGSDSVQWHDVPGLSSVSSTLVRGLRPSNLSFWPLTALLGDPLYAQGSWAVGQLLLEQQRKLRLLDKDKIYSEEYLMGRLTLLDGVKIAYQEWGHHSSASKVLALHGWLDNSNSFSYLGQYLGERGHHVVAIDFAGHGRSSHLPLSSNYTPQKSIFYTKQILDKLEWQRSSIIGHSMGGIIGLGFTSCFPELVTSLTIIDSAGALSARADKTEAAQVRVRNSVMFSKKPLSLEAAQLLVQRGVLDVNYVPGDGDDTLENVQTDGPVMFCHDNRLQLSSFVYHTPEQVRLT
eukprot:gene27932-36796_t